MVRSPGALLGPRRAQATRTWGHAHRPPLRGGAICVFIAGDGGGGGARAAAVPNPLSTAEPRHNPQSHHPVRERNESEGHTRKEGCRSPHLGEGGSTPPDRLAVCVPLCQALFWNRLWRLSAFPSPAGAPRLVPPPPPSLPVLGALGMRPACGSLVILLKTSHQKCNGNLGGPPQVPCPQGPAFVPVGPSQPPLWLESLLAFSTTGPPGP